MLTAGSDVPMPTSRRSRRRDRGAKDGVDHRGMIAGGGARSQPETHDADPPILFFGKMARMHLA